MGLLAVDIGNSNIVVGLFDGERLQRSWRIATRRELTADEFEALLAQLLGSRRGEATQAILASVVPALSRVALDAIRQLTGVEPLDVVPGVRTGLAIRTDNPSEVGADRIVNGVAAHAQFGGPTIVADLGTATTLDLIGERAEYWGGLICPGPQLGVDALAARAARLPRIELSLPARVIGRNTVDSMRSGALHGHAAMVEGLSTRIERELGAACRLVLTGGLAATISPLLTREHVTAPQLTLDGLRLIWQRNHPP